MSTFTEWNGPGGGRGANTKDVLALIDAYNNMNALLSKHIESSATDDVHKFKTALDDAVATLQTAMNAALSNKADKDVVSGLSDTVAFHESEFNKEVSRAQSAESTLQSNIDSEKSRAEGKETEISQAITRLEEAVNDTKSTFEQALGKISFDDVSTTTISGVVAATESFLGTIKARKLIDFVEWTTFSAQYAGTGSNEGAEKSNGVYILGCLSEEWDPDKEFTDTVKQKTARIYVKYVNDRPFDLVVDISATGCEHGAISCTASFQKLWSAEDPSDAWEDMALHLLTNTDSSGAMHLYLGISARGLAGQATIFHVAGENFIAGGTVNGVSKSIGFTHIAEGFNAYRANVDDLRVKALNDLHGTPMLAVEYFQGDDYTAQKILYVADESFAKVYFRQRPSVVLAEEDGEGESTTYIAPVLTAYDLEALSAGGSLMGAIVFWPQWEETEVAGVNVKKAINVPDGWLACDGSTVSTEEYPNLIEILGLSEGSSTATLPRMDYAIMRIKGLFEDVDLPDGSSVETSLTTQELTDAVNALRESLNDEVSARQEGDASNTALIGTETTSREEADQALQEQIDSLDEGKAVSWQGSKDEFDSAKDSLEDGTIVLSPDDLNE